MVKSYRQVSIGLYVQQEFKKIIQAYTGYSKYCSTLAVDEHRFVCIPKTSKQDA
jgi:hypothetical protein